MPERNSRARRRNINTRKQMPTRSMATRQASINQVPTRRRIKKDDELSDNNILFVYQSVVSFVIVIVALLMSIINSTFTKDITEKLKYALSKQITVENLEDTLSTIKNKIDNVTPGVLEIFGFKDDLEKNLDSGENSNIDDDIISEDDNIKESESYSNEPVTNDDVLHNLEFYDDEEKKSEPPLEIIVTPEEE